MCIRDRITIADASQLDFETSATHDLIVEVEDDQGNIIEEVFTVAVNDVGDVNPLLDLSSGVDDLTVDENSSNGTSVGFVVATGGDTSANTFTLSNDAGGRFAIDSATGEITVANRVLLNHEANQSHVVTVAVNDGAGNDYAEDFTITVNNVNDRPTFEMSVTPTFSAESSTPITGASTVVTLSLIHI